MCYSEQEKALKAKQKQIQDGAPAPQTVEETRTADQPLVQNRQQERRARIWNVAEGMRIQMPRMSISEQGDISVQGEKYARKSKESISARKRKMYQNSSFSSLNKRKLQAEQVEEAARAWQEQKERKKEAYPGLSEDPVLYGDALACFLTEDAECNQKLLGQEAGEECIRQFMELDLNADLVTDQAFAAQSPRLEDISHKTEALFYLLDNYPQLDERLSEREREDLGKKMDMARALSDYYQIRKKVVTNAYYRSHYNSEISYRYHESDTLEQKNLTLLLWQMEELKNHPKLVRDGIQQRDKISGYREGNITQEEVRDTQAAKEILRKPERRHEEPDEQPDGAVPDLEVLGGQKLQFRMQMDYLKRKYGNGLMLLSPQEYDAHREEISRDFRGMAHYGRVLQNLKANPEIFRPEDAGNQETERLFRYYKRCLEAERSERGGFTDGTKSLSYSDYKRRAAVNAVHPTLEMRDFIKTSDTMHLDVKWDTLQMESDSALEDIFEVFGANDILEKARKIEKALPQGNRFQWNMLFEETREMTRVEALKHFTQKQNKFVEEWAERVKNTGFYVGAIQSRRLGTDDFVELNRRYLELLDREELQAQYGLTTPELVEEYRQFIERTKTVNLAIGRVDYYMEVVIDMEKLYDKKESRVPNSVPRTIERQLYNVLEKDIKALKAQYEDEKKHIRQGQQDPLYNEFLAFQEKANMWDFPGHRDMAERFLEPRIREQRPEITRQISGEELTVYESALSRELQGKKRKTSVAPEDLRREIEAYNQDFARDKVYTEADRDYIEVGEAQGVWRLMAEAGLEHKNLMAYTIGNRINIYRTRMDASLERIKNMVE